MQHLHLLESQQVILHEFLGGPLKLLLSAFSFFLFLFEVLLQLAVWVVWILLFKLCQVLLKSDLFVKNYLCLLLVLLSKLVEVLWDSKDVDLVKAHAVWRDLVALVVVDLLLALKELLEKLAVDLIVVLSN